MSKLIFANVLVPKEDFSGFQKQTVSVENGRYVDSVVIEKGDFFYDGEGCYLLPDLTDFHAHIFSAGSEIGVHCDAFMLPQGVTTAVDAGSAGIVNMPGFLAEMRHSVTNIRAFINLAPEGLVTIRFGENIDPKYWDVSRLGYFLENYPAAIKGLKIRLDAHVAGHNGEVILQRAVEAAERLHTKLVVHISGMNLPMEFLTNTLRPGDVIAHCYHKNGSGILDETGKLYSCVQKAQKRSIIFDAANGRVHWNLEVERRAMEQGFYPDIISTDVVACSAWRLPVFGLPLIMSRYAALGMPFIDVIKAASFMPKQVLGEVWDGIKIGNLANFALMKWQDRCITVGDCFGNTMELNKVLTNLFTVCNGNMEYRSTETI